MANNLGIPEVSLTNIALAANAVNLVGVAQFRKSVYQPLVVRVLGHDADDGAEEDDATLMALFESKRYGEPWNLGGSPDAAREHVIHSDGTPAPSNATTIFPDYDYTTFE